MPIWTVEGADRDSGAERVLSIDAPTEELARKEAAEKGILVSEVHRSTTDGSGPAKSNIIYQTASAGHPMAPVAPQYDAILTGSRLLRLIGWIYAVLGGLALILGGYAVVYAIMQLNSNEENFATKEAAIYLIVSAMVLLTTFGLLRMIASLAEAVRDLTRNSFYIGNVLRGMSKTIQSANKSTDMD